MLLTNGPLQYPRFRRKRCRESLVCSEDGNSGLQEQGQVRGAHNVSAQEVGRTVKDMLAAAGMPMTLDQHTLLERSLALQEQLAAADTALSIEQVHLRYSLALSVG